MKKTTGELMDIIKDTRNVQQYLADNSDEMIAAPLHSYLQALLVHKQLTKAAVILTANLPQSYGYQIFDGRKMPARDKLIQLAFGLQLSLDEMQTLLKFAGMLPLYPRNKRDSILIHALNKQMSWMDCSLLLDELGETTE